MRPVAVGLVARMLALAQESCFGFLGFEDNGREGRMGLVTAVAEGLFLGIAAGAPSVILSCFQPYFSRAFMSDMRFKFGHGLLLEIQS